MTIFPSFFVPSAPALNYVQTMRRTEITYLDHAAGTFLLPQVKDSLREWLDKNTANPSSIHGLGRIAASEMDAARLSIARTLGCKPSELIFTSGGTEANNLAILGGAEATRAQGQHIITCGTEHPSILESCNKLEQDGFRVTLLSTDAHGNIDLDELKASIGDDTTLITLMWVNNETGLIHPIHKIGQLAGEHGIRFHCDAVQAIGHFPVDVQLLPIDSLSISGHKIGAPAGIGLLYVRKGILQKRQNHGGLQENNVRPGTQNHSGIIALATAIQYHDESLDRHTQHFERLMNHLQHRLCSLPNIQMNRGSLAYAPHILNYSLHNLDGEMLFIRLDMAKIAVSNGSACSSGSQAPSHVLTALGIDPSLAQASLRISLGINTTQNEIDLLCDALEQIVPSIQKESLHGK